MARGRLRGEWEQTSAVLATLINNNPFRGAKARPVTPAQFNPYHEKTKPAAAGAGEPPKAPFDALRALVPKPPAIQVKKPPKGKMRI